MRVLDTLAPAMSTVPPTAFDQQVAELRSYLMKFARLQLRNDAWAEDAVSETVVAALSKPQSFGNRSQLKTWLVGILKHKVVDLLRLHHREATVLSGNDDEGADPIDLLPFDSTNHFSQAPSEWVQPEQQLERQQFFVILEACADKLPAVQGRVFLMREWLELSSEEVCKVLGLTSTNLYVQLHRARLRLRECLELNWFGKEVH